MELNNVGDARRILEKSIIRYYEEPLFVNRIHDNWQMACFKLHDHKQVMIDARDENLNLEPIPNGFVNGYGTSIYLSRGTPRIMQQGLSRENMRVELLNNEDEDIRLRDEILRMGSIHVAEMVKGIYPSLETASQIVQNGSRVCAWSREKAIDNVGVIYYRTKAVGTYKGEGKIALYKDCKHYSWNFEEKCV